MVQLPKIIIAIDGFSACGKSTTAKAVAAKLGYNYIDTGAMYRVVTLHFLRSEVDFNSPEQVEAALAALSVSFKYNPALQFSEAYLNGENVEQEIRTIRVSNQVSPVSAIPLVRKAMVAQQQRMGAEKGIVMDGRDIATNVFPEAEVKVFMQAEMHTRALRRLQELADKGQSVTIEEVLANIETRDLQDTTRKENPLIRAEEAILLDTTHLTIEQQVDIVCDLAIDKMREIDILAPRRSTVETA